MKATDVKKGLFTFLTFFIFQTFFILKNVGKSSERQAD